jgi:hypothetical protein
MAQYVGRPNGKPHRDKKWTYMLRGLAGARGGPINNDVVTHPAILGHIICTQTLLPCGERNHLFEAGDALIR